MVLCFAQAGYNDPVGRVVPVNSALDFFTTITPAENAAQINPLTDGHIQLATGGTYVVSYRVTGESTAAVPPIGINFRTQLFINGGAVENSIASQNVFDSGILGGKVSASVAGYAIIQVPAAIPPFVNLTIRNVSVAAVGVAAADRFNDFTMTILRIR